MLTLARIAVRNLTRNKARNAITVGAIFFGVLMSLFLSAYIHGLHNALIDDTVKARVGAIQVHRRGYFDVKENQPLKLDLPQGGELEKTLRSIPGVHAVTPRLVFSALLTNGTSSTVVVGQGSDPEQEKRVLPKASQDVVGGTLSKGVPNGAILGAELASALSAAPGSTLVLQAASPSGRENALDLEVVGTLHSGSLFESKRFLNLPLAHAQRLLHMEGRVTEYVIAVERNEEIDEVAHRLQGALGEGYEVQTWRELRPSIADIMQIQKVVLSVIGSVFLLIAVFGVANALLMSVMERKREIGTMMAVGVTRRKVSTLFVLEAALQSVLGGVLGALGAFGLVKAFSLRGGLKLQMPDGGPMEIFPQVSPQWVAVAVTAAALGAVLASLYPAWKAASLKPVEALRST